MFSGRVPSSLEPTLLARAVDERKAAQRPFADLTSSNPTREGFAYPADLLEPLSSSGALTYHPDPFGMLAAREAVAADYARRGIAVKPERIVLTASTSESYSFLFKLLCNPGDAVLVPAPSYPLFAYLTRLDGVAVRTYRLRADENWLLDPEEVERHVDGRVRAVLVVAPNNPTGTRLRVRTLHQLSAICARHELALIGDEVFADYVAADLPGAARSVLEQREVLTFGLGGLSKTAGLPQLKLGWIGVAGPPTAVAGALARLEVIADAYLSVATPVQCAAPSLLDRAASVRALITDRLQRNEDALRAAAAAHPACRVPAVEGGWSAIIQAPAVMPDEARALRLLADHGVLLHPGSLYDFDREGYFVVSLLPRTDIFQPAIARALGALDSPS